MSCAAAPQPAAAVASEVREVLVRLEAARVEISGALRAKLTAAANEAAEAEAMGTPSDNVRLPPHDGGRQQAGGNVYDVDDGDDDDVCARVDALVTRLMALRSARSALAAHMKIEGALQEAHAALRGVRSTDGLNAFDAFGAGGGEAPHTRVGAPNAASLDAIEAAAMALRTAARSLADAAGGSPEGPAGKTRDGGGEQGDARTAGAAVPSLRDASTRPLARERAAHEGRGEPRFTEAAAARIARAAENVRGPAAAVLVDAAARTGWPPPINPAALDAFARRWPNGIDRDHDHDRDRPWGGDERERLARAAASLAALQDAAAAAAPLAFSRGMKPGGEAGTAGDDVGIGPSSDGGTMEGESWVAAAMASPVIASLRRHFTGDGAAGDPSRPERMYACASKVASSLGPLVGAALANGRAPPGESDAKAVSDRVRLSVGFVDAVAAAAAAVTREHLLPACARADQSALSPGAAADVPWLHLADEAERFDAQTAALCRLRIERRRPRPGAAPREKGGAANEAPEVRRSALAAMMTTRAEWAERWMAAELSDCLRALDAACDAPGDVGWIPNGEMSSANDVFVFADEERHVGRTDASFPDDDEPGDESASGGCAAAEAVMEAVRRCTSRALALPAAARMPRRFEGFGGNASDDEDASDGDARGDTGSSRFVDARVSYLANVAAAVVDDFAGRVRRKLEGGDVLTRLAMGSGRHAAAKIGAVVAAALNVSRALADHGEEAPLLEIGADLFEEQCAALDAFAEEWIGHLAEAAFEAFSAAAAQYTGGEHLLTFGADDDAARRRCVDVQGDDVDVRGLGAEAAASALLGPALAVLRERLSGLHAALYDAADPSAHASAVRRVAQKLSAHVLREVALGAEAFTARGAERFAADVRAIAAVFRPYARKPVALLKPMTEAGALLTAEVTQVKALAGGVKRVAAGDDEGRAEVARWRDAMGVHRLSDGDVARVVSRRVDIE